MKKTTMAVTVLVAVCAATTMLATLDNQKAFVTKYPDAKASLGKCSTCAFEKIENLDSDGDGVKNIDEIKKGTNPGDPTSK